MTLRLATALSAALCLLLGCAYWGPTGRTVLPQSALTIAAPSETTSRSAISPSPQWSVSPPGCYYVWATRDLPDLTADLKLRLVQAGIARDARAYAFGEECRMESGDISFLPKETDFRVVVDVDSIDDEEALGTAIRAVMSGIQAVPADLIVGPQPGRVEFEFAARDSRSLRLMIELARYKLEAGDLEGAALFTHFQASP